MYFKNFNVKMAIIIFCILCLNVLHGQQSISDEKLTSIIESISKYEYGKSRNQLSELQSAVVKSINSQENLEKLEINLIKVLESNATIDGRRFICQLLTKIGTENSVDVLISMLEETETSNMARYALEKINVGEVDEKLIELLDDVDLNTKIGIINTLGARKADQAIEKFSEYVLNKEQLLANTAATALGKIGGSGSILVIEKLLSKADESVKNALMDSYLLFADNCLQNNEHEKAQKIYSNIFKKSNTSQHKGAALNGLLAVSTKSKATLIISSLLDDDKLLNQVALSHIAQLNSSADHAAIKKNFNTFNTEIQKQIFSIISDHKLKDYLEFVRYKSLDGQEETRVNAILCLGSIGNAIDVTLLTRLSTHKNYKIKIAAQNSLYNVSGEGIDEHISQFIIESEPKSQEELILAVEKRQIKSAKKTLLKTSLNENQRVRIASYKALGIIAEPKDLNNLMKIFIGIKENKELKFIENTLAKVTLQQPNPNDRGKIFLSSIDNIDTFEKRMSLIRILGATGDENAYSKISGYLTDEKEDVQKVAIQSLYNWPNIDPINKLLEIVRSTNNSTHKALALRGFVNLLKKHGSSKEDEIIKYYKKASEYAINKSEKYLIISGVSTVYTSEALNYAATFLDNDELKSEAEEAVLEIIQNGGWDFARESLLVLEKLVKKSTSQSIIERANLIKEEIVIELE